MSADKPEEVTAKPNQGPEGLQLEPDNENHGEIIEKVISATEISNKIYKPATYEEAISNLIYSQYWKKAIKEKIQNLEDHHTWE